MIFIDNILNFLTDKDKRLSTKASIFVFSLITIFIINNITGFSHYYNKERQLDQLKLITELIADSTVTENTEKELRRLESQIFERQNILDHSYIFIKNITTNNSEQIIENIDRESIKRRSDFWFLISTSIIYILITIIAIPVFLFFDRRTPFLKRLASMIIFSLVMLFTSWFNYWLFDKILPDEIFGSWKWNYIINFILQIGLMLGLVFASNTMEGKSTKRKLTFGLKTTLVNTCVRDCSGILLFFLNEDIAFHSSLYLCCGFLPSQE